MGDIMNLPLERINPSLTPFLASSSPNRDPCTANLPSVPITLGDCMPPAISPAPKLSPAANGLPNTAPVPAPRMEGTPINNGEDGLLANLDIRLSETFRF